jgi:hypothetical protein
LTVKLPLLVVPVEAALQDKPAVQTTVATTLQMTHQIVDNVVIPVPQKGICVLLATVPVMERLPAPEQAISVALQVAVLTLRMTQ